MYSTCIFCHADLGSNEAIEHFPIGRRLAFDAAKGRLWVVCRKCERWNLTPIEERWEAIEECERLFSETRLRVSTDNIGMARIREGLELVRIGMPQRPEMAAWRYGDQFGRRRRRHLVYTTGAGVVVAGIIIAGPATGIIAGGGWGVWNILQSANNLYQQRRVRARLTISDVEEPVLIRLKQLNRVSVTRVDDGWGLAVPLIGSRRVVVWPSGRITQTSVLHTQPDSMRVLTGDEAMRAAAKLLPAINASGARKEQVASAVEIIGESAEPAKLFEKVAAGFSPATGGFASMRRRRRSSPLPGHALANLTKEMRLALEMATHEDSERRALEGELALLEAEWRQAEEVASIADDMFVTDATREKLSDLKRSE
ncbi:MAG: hypothetical protein ACHQWU_10880 [Gemmatimonadales bacterium]